MAVIVLLLLLAILGLVGYLCYLVHEAEDRFVAMEAALERLKGSHDELHVVHSELQAKAELIHKRQMHPQRGPVK